MVLLSVADMPRSRSGMSSDMTENDCLGDNLVGEWLLAEVRPIIAIMALWCWKERVGEPGGEVARWISIAVLGSCVVRFMFLSGKIWILIGIFQCQVKMFVIASRFLRGGYHCS